MYNKKKLRKMKYLELHAAEAMNACASFDKAALTEGAIPIRD